VIASHPGLPRSAELDSRGRLAVGGCAMADLAAEHGTPLFVVDVDELRAAARAYVDAFSSRHPRTLVCFALKAFPCSPVAKVLAEEGVGCEVVSAGELAIALKAGVDPELILLHGNAKTDADLGAAIEAGVGLVVIDSRDDVERLRRLAHSRQRVLVRVNPDVPGDTHAAMDTGRGSSKFGVPLEQVPELLEQIGAVDELELEGLHVHLGSQLLSLDVFTRAAAALTRLERFPVYDFGGGLGVAYRPGDAVPSLSSYADCIVAALEELNPDARLIVEPGRSLVARSTLTLYSIVTIKRGARTHVAVDGGMADNLEVALYGAQFAPVAVDGAGTRERCDIVGRHCESGDVVALDAELAAPRVGGLVAVPCTGAYCYALLNNYNGALRPAVVLCEDGSARLAVRRERLDDLLARDLL
jgi:diaminopimelate decarboxylase